MIIQKKLLLFLFEKGATVDKIYIDTVFADSGLSPTDIGKVITQLNNTGLIAATLEDNGSWSARLTDLGVGYLDKLVLPYLPTNTDSKLTPKAELIMKLVDTAQNKQLNTQPMTPDETFKANYTNPKIRERFKSTTGIDPDENPSAFIAYLSYIRLDMLALQILGKD